MTSGLPPVSHTRSASPAEVQLVGPDLQRHVVDALPGRSIGDKVCASDGLDGQLRSGGIEAFAPNRAMRRTMRDGRPLRRDRSRWKVERPMAGLHGFRRIISRRAYRARAVPAPSTRDEPVTGRP